MHGVNETECPEHYTSHPTGIECIDIVEEFPSNCASAIRYIWRQTFNETEDKKLEDLKKALWYVKREIKRKFKIDVDAEEYNEKINTLMVEHRQALDETSHGAYKAGLKRALDIIKKSPRKRDAERKIQMYIL